MKKWKLELELYINHRADVVNDDGDQDAAYQQLNEHPKFANEK